MARYPSMPKIEIADLELVHAIAEDGTVTGAGNRLHLTQSALSHRLKDLEGRLGVVLFLRSPRKMVITSAGEKILATARAVLGELSRVEREVSESKDGYSGVVRVSTGCYTCYRWLPPIMAFFHGKYPKVEIRMDEASTHQAIEALTAGRVDVAIVNRVPKDGIFRSAPLFEDEVVFVLSPKHKLSRKKNIRPADLEGERVLVYPPREDAVLINEVLTPAGVRPAGVLEFPLTEAILEVAASGFAIGFVAQWAAKPYLHSRRLVARRLSPGGYRRTWSAVTLAHYRMPAYFAAFIESMRRAPALSGLGRSAWANRA